MNDNRYYWGIISTYLFASSYAAISFSAADVPPCLIVSRLTGSNATSSLSTDQRQRIIVVGDIHGDQRGLLEVLFAANVTRSINECAWKLPQSSEQVVGTLLVQTGDVVDRGPNTVGALACLDHLQRSAPHGSRFIRTLGNHDIMWLEGKFDYKHKISDTPNSIGIVVHSMKAAIASGALVGAYAHWVNGLPLVFVHAGLRPAMLDHIATTIGTSTTDIDSETVVNYINDRVVSVMNECTDKGGSDELRRSSLCQFKETDPLFQSGPERGNKKRGAIGGPFWTDYSVLEAVEAPLNVTKPTSFVQIVGHTIHFGKIKTTRLFGSVGIDAGMYIGGRAFLEVTPDARFYAVEKQQQKRQQHQQNKEDGGDLETDSDTTQWNRRDLTASICDGLDS